MAGVPETLTIELACPVCDKKSSQRLAKLCREKKFTCPGCRELVRLEGDGLRKIEAAFREIEKAGASLSKTVRLNIKL